MTGSETLRKRVDLTSRCWAEDLLVDDGRGGWQDGGCWMTFERHSMAGSSQALCDAACLCTDNDL